MKSLLKPFYTRFYLWVRGTNDEKCYYSHNRTEIEVRVSNDMTQGFGPEQFLLKRLLRELLKVRSAIMGKGRQPLQEPTTIMAKLFIHYGIYKAGVKIYTSP
ncbi:hypothetical protein [Mucilaginibacter sp.]|uniref:hypothetical protein n=1 Tax=Mucilaginibacter sp. TaxID=1882438 RepID=UPI00260FA3BB|nr:hypothetical protein [Mucilaginibacter sp.]